MKILWIALIPFLLGSRVFAMSLLDTPPLSSSGEEKVDSSRIEFSSCEEAFSEIITEKVKVTSRDYTRSDRWGFTMRVEFHNVSQNGDLSSKNSFICCKHEGQPERLFIQPIENPYD